MSVRYLLIVILQLQVSFKAAVLLNGLSGLVRLLGFPSPYVPSDMMMKAKTMLGKLDQDSSVAEFAVLQNQVKSISDGFSGNIDVAKRVYGSSLRELEQFLKSHDSQNSFCQLNCVATSEGYSCWTTEENRKKMEDDGRREEEQDLNCLGNLEPIVSMKTQKITSVERNNDSEFSPMHDTCDYQSGVNIVFSKSTVNTTAEEKVLLLTLELKELRSRLQLSNFEINNSSKNEVNTYSNNAKSRCTLC